MRALRILGYGLLGVGTLLTLTGIHVWRDRVQREERLRILRAMTPERLLANCGQSFSDSEDVVLKIKVADATPSVAANAQTLTDRPVALARLIEYREPQTSDWVKLEFSREINNQWQPTGWRLAHFDSPSVGVSMSDANAFIAIPILPCIAKKTP